MNRNHLLFASLIIGIALVASSPLADDSGLEYRGLASVSGVAWNGETYFLVGDDDETKILQTPDRIMTVPNKDHDLESIDVVTLADGTELFFLLSEETHTLSEWRRRGRNLHKTAEMQIGNTRFHEDWGRGVEGLAVTRQGGSAMLRIAVVWEGGFAQTDHREHLLSRSLRLPLIAVFEWQPGQGVSGSLNLYYADVPRPDPSAKGYRLQRFRATDIVWNGDALLLLMGASSTAGRSPYSNTWLQSFCPVPSARAALPEQHRMVLYDETMSDPNKFVPGGKNWEAMDWVDPAEKLLVLGYDGPDTTGSLHHVTFTGDVPASCSHNWIDQ